MSRYGLVNCHCPNCGADLADTVIPLASRHMYGGGDTCEDCGRERHFSRLVGIYVWEKDRTVEWLCPDCGHRWERE